MHAGWYERRATLGTMLWRLHGVGVLMICIAGCHDRDRQAQAGAVSVLPEAIAGCYAFVYTGPDSALYRVQLPDSIALSTIPLPRTQSGTRHQARYSVWPARYDPDDTASIWSWVDPQDTTWLLNHTPDTVLTWRRIYRHTMRWGPIRADSIEVVFEEPMNSLVLRLRSHGDSLFGTAKVLHDVHPQPEFRVLGNRIGCIWYPPRPSGAEDRR
jgi:hypothetical protein